MNYTKLKDIKKIHMIGIGGISMSSIALTLQKDGFIITGTDQFRTDMVDVLEKSGIEIYIGSNASMVTDSDLVVYTAAIKQHDPEYVKAKELGIPMYERAVFLGILLENYKKPICIAGTHGKSTTTSMIASSFIDNEADPTVQVGAKLKKLNNLNYAIGNSDYFILEACEYVDSFLNFPHQTAVILNIDFDHLDYFSGIEDIRNSFKKFILMLPQNGILVINVDDQNCNIVLNELKQELDKKQITVITFSLYNEVSSWVAKNIETTKSGAYEFDAVNEELNISKHIVLSVPGKHNIYNSLACIATSFAHDLSLDIIADSLNEFTGAGRRFEFKKIINGNVYVYDDYAHHPTEIKATLEAAKQMNKNNIWIIFQPHTFTRTKELLNDFSNSFFNADRVIISDIYAAREADDGSISSKDLVDKLIQNNVNALYFKTFEEIAEYVKAHVEDSDIVLTVGAGDITCLSNLL